MATRRRSTVRRRNPTNSPIPGAVVYRRGIEKAVVALDAALQDLVRAYRTTGETWTDGGINATEMTVVELEIASQHARIALAYFR